MTFKIFMGLRWGLNPRPEQKFSHENAGKKNRAQINVWIHKKGSDVRRRKCCLFWVTIHTNSNFLSVPHLGNNCHGICLSHHIKRVESRLAERVKPEVDIFSFLSAQGLAFQLSHHPLLISFTAPPYTKNYSLFLLYFTPKKETSTLIFLAPCNTDFAVAQAISCFCTVGHV